MNEEQERQAFEHWAGPLGYKLERRTEEEITHLYRDNETYIVWDAWLARAQLDKLPTLIVIPETEGPHNILAATHPAPAATDEQHPSEPA